MSATDSGDLLGGESSLGSIGTSTFLFTDIEGSTRLWEEHPQTMKAALEDHDRLLREVFRTHGGRVFATAGDSLAVVFQAPLAALEAAVASQRTLFAETWGELGGIRVRIGIHTGAAQERDGNYFGLTLSRSARLMSIAHGGQIVISGVTAELVSHSLPDDISLVDKGAHRLKDLSHPEAVFQVVHPGLPTEFPPLRSLSTVANNLPIHVSSYVGRNDEMARAREILSTERLLTLTGPGGTGKTRLAMHIAADLIAGSEDGVWFVELAEVMAPELVPRTVAAAMKLHGGPDVEITDAVCQQIGASRVLVVLDNCEHLIEACASMASTMLARCPNLRLIATSREVLRINGETAFSVPTLAVPSTTGAADAESAADFAAVQLFIDRAAAALPAFRPGTGELRLIAEICRQLDGLPLAIELAAARTRHLSLEDVATRLSDRFKILTGGGRTGLVHHRTLQATVEWSYDLLLDPEKRAFEQLSVFTNGFTLEAAEAAAPPGSAPGTIDLLSRLVDQSLLIADRDGTGPLRYRMLKTLNQFAAAKLETREEAKDIRLRHARYYADVADEVEPHLLGEDGARWARWLLPEHGNLREALAWSLGTGHSSLAFRLAGALSLHWGRSGLLGTGHSWLGRVASANPDAVSTQILERELRLAWGAASPASAVDSLAALVHGEGDSIRAARLLGAADELRRRLRLESLPLEVTMHNQDESAIRDALGGDAFVAEFERGRALVREDPADS